MAIPQPRQILRNLMFSLDGQLMSTGFSNFDANIGREPLPRQCYEEIGKFNDKGDWTANVKLIEGYGLESEAKIMQQLADDEEESDFLLALRSDTRNSPMDIPGNPALFMVCITTAAPQKAESGKHKRISGEFDPADGRQPNLGVMLFTSRAKVPDPLLETDSPVTSDPQELGELVEGFELAVTVHCHSITGTGDVTAEVEVLSDVDDTFPTPTVQYTFPLIFTNTDPAPGGSVLAPKAQTVVLDGDVAPLPGETAWAIRITITDSDVGGSGKVELSAAANLIPK